MIPTVGRAESWRPAALYEFADGWSALGADVQSLTDELAVPDLDGWTGATATAGADRLNRLRDGAAALAGALTLVAETARRGALQLTEARDGVVDLVAELRARGYRVADDGTVSAKSGSAEIDTDTTALTASVRASLQTLGNTDVAVAAQLSRALHSPAPRAPTPPRTGPAAAELVADWPTMSQDSIAEQLAELTPQDRQQLIESAPRQVGNTDGVPWPMRMAANRINIAAAIDDQQRILDRPENEKIGAALAGGFGIGWGLGGIGDADAERRRAAVYTTPALRAAAIAAHDRDANRRIDFYRGLLTKLPDPTGRTPGTVERQILAFDPERESFVELHGDLRSASSLGVLVPGLNTTVLDSAANTKTARRFVAEGRGTVAMITYLGGPFPTGNDFVGGILDAANGRYALDMAPRLVAFSEDVNRTVDTTGRHIPVTYLGHSYGGSILGTAERLGLTADRTVYVEAAGAGVGVHSSDDWHNRNPDVERYSMTAPDDPIAWVQGLPGGPHGADPDEMSGVWRLPTGRRLDGRVMSGLESHSDVVNEPSDAWRQLLDVITGRR